MNEKDKVKVGDTVFCYKSLPFGESGRRKVIDVALNHSIYVRLKPPLKDGQDFWQVMWRNFRMLKLDSLKVKEVDILPPFEPEKGIGI